MTIRYAQIGGGPGSMIGEAHRLAARAAGFELVGGVFSRDIAKSRAQAEASGLDPSRGFASLDALLDALGPGIDAVVVCAPNTAHFAAARAALSAGKHAIVDKPMTVRAAEAEELVALADASGLRLGVTYTWAALEAFRVARRLIADGAIGEPRLIEGAFVNGWLATRLEDSGAMAALSRTVPALAGVSGATGDIATHLLRMAEVALGASPVSISAELLSFVDGRALDDTGLLRLRWPGGARGVFTVSQSAAGETRAEMRFAGSVGSIAWSVADAEALTLARAGAKPERIEAKTEGPFGAAPPAPPAYLNGFARLYADFAAAIREGRAPAHDGRAGLAGVRFVEAALASSAAGGAWTELTSGGA